MERDRLAERAAAPTVTSMPSKPSSPHSTSRSHLREATIGTPFSSLYEFIALATSARRTAAADGGR